eukprot:TRINITY_DN15938_c0_g1_i1.p1 TRINITY_DN15938_c0_g1~~TRINITY_DN15938_c0_g1_i1.p1  ORF type:complete len:164 (+),score=27.16 TRINITY_DN15938_c0_g1_i1:116-607(+)
MSKVPDFFEGYSAGDSFKRELLKNNETRNYEHLLLHYNNLDESFDFNTIIDSYRSVFMKLCAMPKKGEVVEIILSVLERPDIDINFSNQYQQTAFSASLYDPNVEVFEGFMIHKDMKFNEDLINSITSSKKENIMLESLKYFDGYTASIFLLYLSSNNNAKKL